MRRVGSLKITQFRPGMLYAQRCRRAYAPLLLVMGMAAWLWMVYGVTNSLPPAGAIGLGCLFVLLAAGVRVVLIVGEWLIIDRSRGWVHWQRRGCNGAAQESFSPNRISKLKLIRRGFSLPLLGWWEIHLLLDHPRLTCFCLGRRARLSAAQQLARETAAVLETGWEDEQNLLHAPRPLDIGVLTDMTKRTWAATSQPPPEIHIKARGGRSLLVLAGIPEFPKRSGVFLLYALLWCLWAWSWLMVEVDAFGPFEMWNNIQFWIISLLSCFSFVGLIFFLAALRATFGRQILKPAEGEWLIENRWLGLAWGAERLRRGHANWIRRVDSPNEGSGLWVPGRRAEVRVGQGLSPEALAWLQQLLTAE